MSRRRSRSRRRPQDDPEVRKVAAFTSEVTEELEQRSRRAPRPGYAPAAGWILILLFVVLLVSQWELVAQTVTGRETSWRSLGLAIILALSGIRLALTPGRRPFAAAAAVLAGATLVLGGVLAEHDRTSIAVVEGTCGAVAALAGLVAWLSPARRTGEG